MVIKVNLQASLYLLLLILSFSFCQYNKKLTYIGYSDPIGLNSDYHNLFVEYNDGIVTVPLSTDNIDGGSWKVTEINGNYGGNTSDGTIIYYNSINVYNGYRKYLLNSNHRYFVVWNTDTGTNSNDIICSGTISSLRLRVLFFTCYNDSKTYYDSITSDVPKSLIRSSDMSVLFQVKGYKAGGLKENDNSINNFGDMVLGTTNVFNTICP